MAKRTVEGRKKRGSCERGFAPDRPIISPKKTAENKVGLLDSHHMRIKPCMSYTLLRLEKAHLRSAMMYFTHYTRYSISSNWEAIAKA